MDIKEERIKTNLLMLDYFDMWDEFHFKSINDTKTLRYYNLISNLIDSQIGASIRWLDSEEAEEYFKGESTYQTEVFQVLENEWDEILEAKYLSVEALLSEVYRRGKAQGYSDIREHIRYTPQDKLALQFARDYNFRLIQRLSDDTVHQIKNRIISGFLAGEHPNKIAPKILGIGDERLQGSTFTPKQRATMIARTEISRVQNTGILQSYVNEGYTEVKILTAEDNNVCTICLSYAFKFNKDGEITFENRGEEKVHNIIKLISGGEFPPFHPNCRCTYLSVWESKGEPPKNPFLVNITSWDFYDMNKPNSKIKFKELSETKIPNDLPNLLSHELLSFDNYYGKKYIDGKLFEYGYLANLTHEGVSKYVSIKEENHINFNEAGLLIYSGDELIATHTHLSRVPFNYKDIDTFFVSSEVHMKYLVVHTPEDIFIGEFTRNAFEHKNEIIEVAKEDYYNMMERNIKFQSDSFATESLWDNYLKNEVLNKYITFWRISK